MKYLIIDTNIYIDMVVSRNESNKAESYNQLMKLLDYGEVKLIVPKIVITEVFRHINNEIDKVGQSISMMKSKAKSLYWINHIEDLVRFNRNLKPIKSGINALVDEFNSNKDKYKEECKELFDNLFNDDNSIILEENQSIIFNATQRKVHKRRPFHYGGKKDNDKDSMADSIIIETLINIDELLELNIDDKIYFISRNPVDFSDKGDKNLLHEDIIEDLELKGLLGRVNYRLLFTKTLVEDFKDEIEAAGLTAQLELEVEYERKEDIKESYCLQEDMERESVGLSSLSSDYEERLCDLDEIRALMDLLEEMKNDIQKKCEEFSLAYYDLEEVLGDKSIESLEELIRDDSLMQVIIGEYDDKDGIKDEILSLINWKVGDECYADFGEYFKNEDYFSLNTTLATFHNSQNSEYMIKTVGYLDQTSDYSDDVYIRLYKESTLLAEGKIIIYYGYIEFNDDGNVGDGAAEDISMNIDNIIDKLLDIKNLIIRGLDNRLLKCNKFIEVLS